MSELVPNEITPLSKHFIELEERKANTHKKMYDDTVSLTTKEVITPLDDEVTTPRAMWINCLT